MTFAKQPIILNRSLPNNIEMLWNCLTNAELLAAWFTPPPAPIEKDTVFSLSFSDSNKPDSACTLKVTRLVTRSFIEFALYQNKAEQPSGLILWRITQTNGSLQFTVIDNTLSGNLIIGLLQSSARKKFWLNTLNRLEFYLEQATGKKAY
jgi:uncharacterized protein YndB with AHSA1/START domain